MADIASVFHWPLSELNALPLDELILWQAKARARRVRPVGFVSDQNEAS